MKKQKLTVAVASALLFTSEALFAASFVVDKIEVVGNSRVDANTIRNLMPVRPGQPFSADQAQSVMQAVFKAGMFEDVKLSRRDNTLIIEVIERASIAVLNITGNKAIKTEQLEKGLKSLNIAVGQSLDRQALSVIEKELVNQYRSMGFHQATVTAKISALGRGRAGVDIQINEGPEARIQSIDIVGNKVFSDAVLLRQLESGKRRALSLPMFSRRDKYQKEKLIGDLDRIVSYYRDRGYLKFKIIDTDVDLTEDKKGINIKINVDEGGPYKVGDIQVAGNHGLDQKTIQQAITLREGAVFSQTDLEETRRNLGQQMGKKGFAFAKIVPKPLPDEANSRVGVRFDIQPGKRSYVRRIVIRGNNRTKDEVYRRELRQLESSWFSRDLIERSKVRLQRLPYVESVKIDVEPVAGTQDQVDLTVVIAERSSNQFSIGAGYSSSGILLNLNLKQDNFMGTGKRVAVQLDNSATNKTFRVSYTNPYATVDGISVGYDLFYNKYDSTDENISKYVTNLYGGNVRFTMPISEDNAFHISAGYENRELVVGSEAPTEVSDFVAAHGTEFKQIPLKASFVHDSRNRSLFPTAGQRHSIALTYFGPGSDLEFYKATYSGAYYKELNEDYTLAFKGRLAVGDGRGDLEEMPFFSKFRAGGIRTVRGYESNSLGPVDSNGDATGGDAMAAVSAQILSPMPFFSDMKNVRLSAFVDAGNVFADSSDFDTSELRVSAGLGAVWISPLGPLEISYAVPLNLEDGDEEQRLQFTFGTSF